VFNHIISQIQDHIPIVAEYDSTQSIDSVHNAIKHEELSQKYFIVAHSLGGILAHRIACEDPNVVGIITISTPFGGHNAAAFLRYAFPKLLVMKDLAPYSNSVAYSRNIIPPCRWLNVVTTGGGSPFMANANDGVVSVKSQRCVKPTDELLLATNHFEVVQHSTVINAINSIVKGTVL
jgi:pimeloyl-ACP methyl ester carboxylesterase